MAIRNLSYDQFADAGPSPDGKSALTTIVHLADSAGFNLKHGSSHLADARKEAAALGPAGHKVVWHLDHATKHHIATDEDLTSMREHIEQSEFLRDAVNEITSLTNHHQGWGR
jgi:hypothetical protein